jgi:hypothetical protein
MGDWEEIEYHEIKRYFYISQPYWRSALAEEMVSCDPVSWGRGENEHFQLEHRWFRKKSICGVALQPRPVR